MRKFRAMSWIRRHRLLRRNVKEIRGENHQKFPSFVWHCKVAQLSLFFVFVTAAINQTESSKILHTFEGTDKTPPITGDVGATNVLGNVNATEIFNYSHNDGNDKAHTTTDCMTDDGRSCSRHLNFMEFSSIEKEVVDRLIKKWAPIVWLAPEEKFMPLGVEEFLEHVHPIDKDKTFIPGMPIGDGSERAYLVTNAEIDELMKNETSFIYGRNPNKAPVPIYAVVALCSKIKDKTQKNYLQNPDRSPADTPSAGNNPRGPYIPVSFNIIEEHKNTMRRSSRLYPVFKKVKRSLDNDIDLSASPQMQLTKDSKHLIIEDELISSGVVELSGEEPILSPTRSIHNNGSANTINSSNDSTENVNKFIANLADNVKFSTDIGNAIDNLDDRGDTMKMGNTLQKNIPAFHVTYWMFYPYSQGKTMCTLNLGPLGHIPFPALYGFCLGRRKDIGSHIGDWEHMSLYFNGAAEPEALYVSAHDAGAYYTFNSLTGSFEFKKQETRKGILQRPNFPKTVTTFNNHPVLFAAKGSHGLWTAPGKHRFVKVARLYDINGFGTLWNTRKSIHISYENIKPQGRSLSPTWLSFKGKWGNPKSNCHPFRRIGLNFCEYTDGPTGIPLKKSHFECGATYR